MSRRSRGAGLDEIEAVYTRDLAKLQRLASAIVGSRDAGCDAVQDAFARAVQRRAEFRREGSLEGWLWKIVLSTARDAARSRGLRRWLQEENDTAAVDDHAAVREVIGRLPDRQRSAIFLRYYADLDYGAIAEALEISVGTVGATLSQARENLRHVLTEVAR
jgi:RNA polymerase sigma-70 factor (ECF subfamily)